TMDAGANASVLPALRVASLVGLGALVAALPASDILGVPLTWWPSLSLPRGPCLGPFNFFASNRYAF
ncbi:MAG: hypothetical protein WAT36_15625, partial [Chromatiaceae bacterium]